MSDIQKKLQGLLGTEGLMSGSQWRSKLSALEELRASGEFEIESVVPGEIVGDEEESFYLVRQDFPLDAEHGQVALGAVLSTDAAQIALSANDSELIDFDPKTAVFVDTETTGLMGGAGTTTFLIGAGYFVEGGFRLDQCFMRDFDEEGPMLTYLKEVFGRAETVVSYNGKSFDLPLLRTRFITNRIPFSLDGAMHFDLVHAARRLWKKRLGDCSLGNIERAILGLRRHGDVSGAEIPRIWLDYLHTRDARKLEAVFYHHKMDILSLVTLTAVMAQRLAVPDGEGFEHHEDRLSLVRIHFRQKRYDEVLDLAKGLLETDLKDDLRGECLEMVGLAAKRRGKWDVMEDAWTHLLQDFPKNLLARSELAKHYEHRKRDLPRAERLCADAVDFLETTQALHEDPAPAPELAGFRHRLERIRKKLAKYRGTMGEEGD